ncbi:MAG: preprotein translocase subunit SecA [Clostridium sp.]|nr:preprotein translocase subunit SecA [Clostridium sp.]
MFKLLEKIIGSYSDRELKRINPIVDKIENLETQMEGLDDEQLKAKTPEFKKRIREGESLDDILPEAFAVVREASKRVLGMKHFRVQLIGGIVLHQGRIAEMKTGEGKTLVATLPVYLNALEGKGVHVVTVNDYLAKRDSEWMGKIYNFLGLSVGLIVHGLNNSERREAYDCDITYGTNNEYGFDYLRDNMVIYKQDMVQRELNFAIVDEVDSILVDEARTPLIISGAGDKSTDLYTRVDAFVGRLKVKVFKETDDKELDDNVEADYIVDEKANTAALTADGIKKSEDYFAVENLSDPDNLTLSHHINQALRARGLMKRDKDYVIKDGQIIIVDEFTGRLMYGRRYSNGLHQAIEAKEGVKVERESKTLATVTFQNYFRMYKKLSGMTGTAQTEEQEFQSIYSLDVVVIPTNMPIIRKDNNDSVYKSEGGKFRAVARQVEECYKKGQPVLIGTISIEKSEQLSSILKKSGVPHQVLNAKYHEREAEIIAQAGKLGAVTIATNMAGRGTDIVLGGNAEYMAKQEMRKKGYDEDLINQATGFYDTFDGDILDARKTFREIHDQFKKITNLERDKVIEAGGLFIIGTERHESRRIDNQLRGRSGRQGDIGESRFYISLEDDLMRLFGSDRLMGMVDALGLGEDEPIERRMLSNAIEAAQKRVEGKNFAIRKSVLEYDDVMNKQREVIYRQRRKVLDGENLKENIIKMIEGIAGNIVELYCMESPYPDDWDWEGIKAYAEKSFVTEGLFEFSRDEMESLSKDSMQEKILENMIKRYEEKESEFGPEFMRELERVVLLRIVDQKWMNHIDDMDQLQQGIRLRAFGQRDPVIEYKFEGFEMFEEMNRNIQTDVVRVILNTQIDRERIPRREKVAEPMVASHGKDSVKKPTVKKQRVGRNDPCPCGSGKKYKKCCGVDN